MAGQNQIVTINMTNFFNRELMMYSLGDIRFKKPISLKAVAYTLAFLILWTLPLLLAFGLPLDPFRLVVYLAPPIILGQVAIRPLFGGKTLMDFVKTAIGFVGEPKGWADMKPFDSGAKTQLYSTEHEIWISRRREYAMLADMIEEERAANAQAAAARKPAKSKKPAKVKKSKAKA